MEKTADRKRERQKAFVASEASQEEKKKSSKPPKNEPESVSALGERLKANASGKKRVTETSVEQYLQPKKKTKADSGSGEEVQPKKWKKRKP